MRADRCDGVLWLTPDGVRTEQATLSPPTLKEVNMTVQDFLNSLGLKTTDNIGEHKSSADEQKSDIESLKQEIETLKANMLTKAQQLQQPIQEPDKPEESEEISKLKEEIENLKKANLDLLNGAETKPEKTIQQNIAELVGAIGGDNNGTN